MAQSRNPKAEKWTRALSIAEFSEKWHEGSPTQKGAPVLTVYRDERGVATVAWGHCVMPTDHLEVGDEISRERADAFFKADHAKTVMILTTMQERGVIASTDHIGASRLAVLIEMAYALGIVELSGFEDMFGHVNKAGYAKPETTDRDLQWALVALEIHRSRASYECWGLERTSHLSKQMQAGEVWYEKHPDVD